MQNRPFMKHGMKRHLNQKRGLAYTSVRQNRTQSAIVEYIFIVISEVDQRIARNDFIFYHHHLLTN